MKPFKEDFDKIQKRFIGWWEGKIVDRMLIYVPAPWPPPGEKLRRSKVDPEALYLDAETIFEIRRRGLQKVYHGGESFPWYCPYAPEGAFYGAKPIFDERSIW